MPPPTLRWGGTRSDKRLTYRTVWRYATRLLASNAAVATYGLAVLVNRPFLRRIFGSRDGIHGRLDGPISAMIENRT